MFEACGENAIKTLLAIRDGDSIAGVARKIDENRETIRRVVNSLEDAGVVEYADGLSVVTPAVRAAALELVATSASVSPPSIPEAYLLPQFAGPEYAYTAIDAVYIWTRGGYQVARGPTDYPLFIAVEESTLDEWTQFFERFDIPVGQERQPAEALEGPIQVVLEPRESETITEVDGRPVIPLDETVAFAREHYATFQSALEMLDQMYDEVDTDADYRREYSSE